VPPISITRPQRPIASPDATAVARDRLLAGAGLQLEVAFCPGLDRGPPIPLALGETRIGRELRGAPERTLSLPDPRVSRVHATLSVAATGEVVLSDERSRNGLFVNGARVERQHVRDGDVIRLGNTVLLVCRGGRPSGDEPTLGIVGRAPSVGELRRVIQRVGPSGLPVVIVGATGSGKELVARALHAQSGRKGRFLALNCAAMPGTLVENALFGHRKGAYTDATSDQPGAFTQADGGTLFLDEIGDLALEAQPKLLRVLENREVTPVGGSLAQAVDLRILVATHVPLDVAMKEGRFREDLYARLAGVVIKVPPLAARREDVLPLLSLFLGDAQRPMTADFVESLLAYGWPRNVRELQKLAERLPVLHPDAAAWQASMLDDEMRLAARGEPPPDDALPEHGPPTREELLTLLEQCRGNVARLARMVHRSRKQVYRWMDFHAVSRGTGRPS
jgi:DNA-binding NtrC family response regulator